LHPGTVGLLLPQFDPAAVLGIVEPVGGGVLVDAHHRPSPFLKGSKSGITADLSGCGSGAEPQDQD
jgi:hypothetical protein